MSNASPFTQLWKQSEDKKKQTEKPSPTPTPPIPTTPTPTPIISPISPERNFTKVSNTIRSEMFKGTSQKTYMALYKMTRGAIVPKRTVKVTRNDLMSAADVSEVTLVKHVTYLERILKLIKKTSVLGDNGGASYEVFLPEEIGLDLVSPPPTTPTPTTTTTPTSIQKLGVGDVKKVGVVGGGYPALEATSYEDSKTLLKTKSKDNDDESGAFAELNRKMAAAAKKLTGKSPSKKEVDLWADLADLLILQLEIAASRAGAVSSVPAFLTEVLRRQFFAAHQQKPYSKPNKVKRDTVGKSENVSYEIKPLDAEEREATVEHLREFVDSPYLIDFEKWYTPEDWEWITEQLKS